MAEHGSVALCEVPTPAMTSGECTHELWPANLHSSPWGAVWFKRWGIWQRSTSGFAPHSHFQGGSLLGVQFLSAFHTFESTECHKASNCVDFPAVLALCFWNNFSYKHTELSKPRETPIKQNMMVFWICSWLEGSICNDTDEWLLLADFHLYLRGCRLAYSEIIPWFGNLIPGCLT